MCCKKHTQQYQNKYTNKNKKYIKKYVCSQCMFRLKGDIYVYQFLSNCRIVALCRGISNICISEDAVL